MSLRLDRSYSRLAAGVELPDGSKRVYCYHVRKTGGTSLHASFLALGGEDPLAVQRRIAQSPLRRTISGPFAFVGAADNQPGLLEAGDYFYAWSHLPAHQLVLPPRTFTVTVLRDPVRRVESYYRYLVAGDDIDAPLRVPDEERAIAADGFDRFLEQLPRKQLLRQLYTFSASFDISEAAAAIRGCSFVMFTENFAHDLDELATRLERPLTCRHERASRGTLVLSEGERTRLRAALEPEYELFRLLERPVSTL